MRDSPTYRADFAIRVVVKVLEELAAGAVVVEGLCLHLFYRLIPGHVAVDL